MDRAWHQAKSGLAPPGRASWPRSQRSTSSARKSHRAADRQCRFWTFGSRAWLANCRSRAACARYSDDAPIARSLGCSAQRFSHSQITILSPGRAWPRCGEVRCNRRTHADEHGSQMTIFCFRFSPRLRQSLPGKPARPGAGPRQIPRPPHCPATSGPSHRCHRPAQGSRPLRRPDPARSRHPLRDSPSVKSGRSRSRGNRSARRGSCLANQPPVDCVVCVPRLRLPCFSRRNLATTLVNPVLADLVWQALLVP